MTRTSTTIGSSTAPRSRRLALPVALAAMALPVLLALLLPWRSPGWGGLVGLASLLGFAAAAIWWDKGSAAPRAPEAPAPEPEMSVVSTSVVPAAMTPWQRRQAVNYRMPHPDIRQRPEYRRAISSGSGSPVGLLLGVLAMVLVGGVLFTVLLPAGPFGWAALFFLGLPLLGMIGAAGAVR